MSMVNDRGGGNHIKFNNLSQRLAKVQQAAQAAKIRPKGSLDTVASAKPATGEQGCHFQDELERCKALDTCSRFKRFYYAIWPMCQSLPELLYHAAKISELLEEQISQCPAIEVSSYMQLVSVLARDLQEDTWPYFHRLFAALTQKLSAVITVTPGVPSPELTGQLFECLSYLIKFSMVKLVENHDSMRQYYGLLLGHSTSFVRDMSARCFVLLMRKLKQGSFTSHVKKLLKAVAGQFRQIADPAVLPIAILEMKNAAKSSTSENLVTPRMMHLIDGVSLLLYYNTRGVRGCMHSKGAQRLAFPLECMRPVSQEAALEVLKSSSSAANNSSSSSSSSSSSNSSSSKNRGKESKVAVSTRRSLSSFSQAVREAYTSESAESSKQLLTYCAGQVMSNLTIRIFRHVHPRNMAQLWLTMIEAVNNLVVQFRSLNLIVTSDIPPGVLACAECSMQSCVEIMVWCLSHSNGRGLSDKGVKSAVGKQVVQTSLDLVECIFIHLEGVRGMRADALTERNRDLFCRTWLTFPRESSLLQRIDSLLALGIKSQLPTPAVLLFSNELFGTLPNDLVRKHLMRPVLQAAVGLSQSSDATESWLVIVLEIFVHLKDVRGVSGAGVDDKAIGADIGEVNSKSDLRREQKKKKEGQEWDDAMEYENVSDEGEGDNEEDEALQRLLKSCSKELLSLANSAIDALQQAVSGSGSQSVEGSKIGSLACMVLRWAVKAFPESLHDQWAKGSQYLSLQKLLIAPLTRNFFKLSAQLETSFLAQVVVLVCVECKEIISIDTSALTGLTRSYAKYFAQSTDPSLSSAWCLLELLRQLDARQGKLDLVAKLGTELSNEVFERISSLISTPSYWLRLDLLRIAAYLPPPQVLQTEDAGKKVDEVRTVDIISLVLEAASTSPHLRTEREYARHMSNIEVLVRGGRIPTNFVRLLCSVCLSMLHTKFQPFWEPTIAVLVAAAGYSEGEAVLWPLLLQSIETLGARNHDDINEMTAAESEANEKTQSSMIKSTEEKQKLRLLLADDDNAEAGDLEEDAEDSSLNDSSVSVAKKPFLHSCFVSLMNVDSGEQPVPVDIATSKIFYYRIPSISSDVIVSPDSRVDADTAYQSSWSILRRVPSITMNRSKVVVPMFMAFLCNQYYQAFPTDPELPWLRHVGLFSPLSSTPVADESSDMLVEGQEVQKEAPLIPLRILKSRLKMFLQVFSQVSSPRSLFRHKFLYSFYSSLLSNPESSVCILALDCLYTYKPTYLMPFKESLKRLLDDRYMRDEMVTFDISTKNSTIDPVQRGNLIPLIIRLVYGRFAARAKASRASKEQSLARRAAALTFLSSLELSEQVHFVQLVYRTLVPKNSLMQIAVLEQGKGREDQLSQQLSSWYASTLNLVHSLASCDMQSVTWERQSGFLNLLQQVIRIMGFSVSEHVPVFAKLVILMLTNAQAVRGAIDSEAKDEEADDLDLIEDDEPDALIVNNKVVAKISASYTDTAQSLRVRTLCLSRLAELIHQYRTVYNFNLVAGDMLRPMYPLLESMPFSIAGSTKPPALLRILHAFVQYSETVGVVSSNVDIVKTVIRCVGSRVDFDVAKIVMDILTRLLDSDANCILPHALLIIQSFSKRFVGAKYNEIAELRLSELNITPSGSVKQELNLLCRIAEGIFTQSDVVIDGRAVANLATLLLGMLRTYTTNKKIRVEESWVGDILRIYKTLLSRMDDVQPHVAFISRLFGPAGHSQSLFNNPKIREMLASVYVDLSKHASTNSILLPSAAAIVNLVKVDLTLLGRNFSTSMPIFQALSAENNTLPVVLTASQESSLPAAPGDMSTQRIEGWSRLLCYSPSSRTDVRNGQMCTVVIFECIRCLYDEEMVIRTAALASLKSLVKDVRGWNESVEETGGEKTARWSDILLSTLMPAVRKGLKESPDTIKKGFILLLSCIIRTFGQTQAGLDEPFLHADLLCLLHEDPEQDFFENITHIQTHRRVRAMMKLRMLLSKSVPSAASSVKLADLGIEEEDKMEVEESVAVSPHARELNLSTTSLVHVLLPLAFHPLFSDDFLKKDHTPLMHEAAHFLGAIALHLPWTQFFGQIRVVLKQLDKNKVEKEKILLLALCSLLDAFHFDMSGNEEAEDINVPSLREMPGVASKKEEEATKTKEVNKGGGGGGEEEEDPGVAPEDMTEIVEAAEKAPRDPASSTGKSISQVVINSVMPWVQVFLLKSEKDHKGNDSKVVRTGVAVALTKLICQLQAPVVPEKKKLALFMNLVIRVVGTLKSRDTSARDQARDSLSKMVITMGLAFLQPVIYELQHTLIEGYQRHVCNYTLRSLLSTVLEAMQYSPPLDAPCIPVLDENEQTDSAELPKPEFDACIPMIMQSVMDDLNGVALDDREAEGAIRQTIREAKGSKANEILEMTAKSLLFRPTYALKCVDQPQSVSSLHALSTPMLEALNNCEDADLIGRINEGLQRVALGLSKNPSLVSNELLLYLHATLQPFVAAIIRDYEQHKRSLGMINSSAVAQGGNFVDADANADEEVFDDLPSYLKEESSDEEEAALYSQRLKHKKGDNVTGYRANTWLPMDRKSATDQKSVIEQRNKEMRERDQVLDGASAPKLTGANRHKSTKSKSSGSSTAGGGSDPAAIVAVKFCLTLFISAIKKNQLDGSLEETRTMCMPFIPLLGQCLRIPGAANVVALSMRCLCALLSWNLPVESSFSRAVGARMMKVMFRGGVLLSTDNELVQACIRGLTSLFDLYNAQRDARTGGGGDGGNRSKGASKNRNAVLPISEGAASAQSSSYSHPLSETNTRTLLKMMTISIMEVTSSYQNAAFSLIKSIIAARLMLPEIYDLISKLTEQIVLSQRKGVRLSTSQIVVDFMSSYPLGEKRLQGHMKQLIANCAYEYEDGRHATLDTLQLLCRNLPLAALEDHAQMIFLPMTLRLVNDESSSCREAAAGVITSLSRRIGSELFTTLLGYAEKWLSSGDVVQEQALDGSIRALIRTGAQCSGLLVTARPDVLKKSSQFRTIIDSAVRSLAKLAHISEESQASKGSLEKREMAKFDEGVGESGGTESWAAMYHILVMLETFYTHLPSGTDSTLTHFGVSALDKSTESSSKKRKQDDAKTQSPLPALLVLEVVQEAMLYPHAWVRAAASRVLGAYLQRRDVTRARLSLTPTGVEILLQPNALYHLARRLCIVLNQPVIAKSLLQSVSSSLVFVIRAMFQNPDLAVLPADEEKADNDDNEEGTKVSRPRIDDRNDGEVGAEEGVEGEDEEESDGAEDDEDDEGDDEDGEAAQGSASVSSASLPKTGASWAMQRLRGLGVDSRGNRRHYVLNVLRMLVAACTDSESGAFLREHLSQMIEVAMRCHLTVSGPDPAALKALKEEAALLLDELEARVGAAIYIGAFSEVQRRVESSKANKKRLQAMDAVTNPTAFAMAKIAKRKRDVESRKRKQSKSGKTTSKRSKNAAIIYEE